MGTADHDAALAEAQAKFDALTTEVLNDPGLSEEEKDAVFAVAAKVAGSISGDAEALSKGLKVGKMAYSLFKDPLGMLGKVGGFLGL